MEETHIDPDRNKSFEIAMALCLVLGPLGLFYSSAIGGFVLSLAACIIFILNRAELNQTFFFFWLCLTLISVMWSAIFINKETERVSAFSIFKVKPSYGYLITLTFLVGMFWIMYDKKSNSFKIDNLRDFSPSDPFKSDKVEIINTVQTFYHNLSSGVYSSENANPADVPLYNYSLADLSMVGFGVGMLQMMTTIVGDSDMTIFSAEPSNIIVTDCNGQQALVSYMVTMQIVDEVKIDTIALVAKKIGGEWKLDGKKVLYPNEK